MINNVTFVWYIKQIYLHDYLIRHLPWDYRYTKKGKSLNNFVYLPRQICFLFSSSTSTSNFISFKLFHPQKYMHHDPLTDALRVRRLPCLHYCSRVHIILMMHVWFVLHSFLFLKFFFFFYLNRFCFVCFSIFVGQLFVCCSFQRILRTITNRSITIFYMHYSHDKHFYS